MSPETLARIRNLRVRHEDREPVASYEQAVWRLIAEFERTGEYYIGGPLPFAAQLVCDIYWVDERRLRRDIARYRNGVVDG